MKKSLLFFTIFYLNLQADANIFFDNIPQCSAIETADISFCVSRSSDGALKPELLKNLKKIFNIQVFIESGTYLGSTSLVAAPIFDLVYTVELSPEIFNQANKNLIKKKNIHNYLGDTSNLFPVLLPKIMSRALFYLDGHYSGGNTAKGSTNTPILKELAAIRDAKKIDSVIIVDDIRCFQNSLHPEIDQNHVIEGYPSLAKLVLAILEIDPTYQICFLGDALLAFPLDPSVKVSEIVRACAIHRLSSAFSGFSATDIQNANYEISKDNQKESDELRLYYEIYGPGELARFLRCFGAFWHGLILNEQSNPKGLDLIHQAAANSADDWPAHWFLNPISINNYLSEVR